MADKTTVTRVATEPPSWIRRACATLAAVVALGLGPAGARALAGGKTVDGVVNLNTAPPEMLSALPGIGPSKAIGIIAYRVRHPFRTVDELVRVKGIGRRMVKSMRAHLAVSGPSTARAVMNLPASAAPSEPAPPPARAPPPTCRPVVLPPPPAAVARAIRATQRRAVRVAANHCRPPA